MPTSACKNTHGLERPMLGPKAGRGLGGSLRRLSSVLGLVLLHGSSVGCGGLLGEHRGSGILACSQAHLIGRLRGGGSAARPTAEGPLINDVLHMQGAYELFTSVEVEALKKKFLAAGSDRLPVSRLSELRVYISNRRDKLSRALMRGGELSESAHEEEQEQEWAPPADKQPQKRRRTEEKDKPSGKDKTSSSQAGGGSGGETGIKRSALAGRDWGGAEKAKKKPRGQAAEPAHGPAKESVEHKERDMLHYNPSLKELEESRNSSSYLGWSQGMMMGGVATAGTCELVISGKRVRVVSSSKVELGDLKRNANECLLKLFKHLAPPIKIEASLSCARLEMLFYGPMSCRSALERVLMDYNLPYKGPSVEQPKEGGKKIDKEKEEIQLAGVISFGGSMEDLLEDQSMHDDMAELMAPPNVRTALMEHQRKALHWMVQREAPSRPIFWEPHLNHFSGQRGWINSVTRMFSQERPKSSLGGMLADEMGLGKTLTVICLIMRDLEAARAKAEEAAANRQKSAPWNEARGGSTLIVCPLSVLYTWADQLSVHTDGSARLLLYHGPQRPRHSIALTSHEIVLTTYNVLASEYIPDRGGVVPASPLHSVEWRRIVLDEAHVISNRLTMQSKAVLGLKAESRWVVTGTPIQNKIEDVYPMLAFLRIHPLDDYHWFTRLVLKPLREKDPTSLARLRKVLKVFCLRRTKDMKMNGRPLLTLTPKLITLRKLRLTEREQEVYDTLHSRGRQACYSFSDRSAPKDTMMGFTQVLVVLLRLRQFCDHPCLMAASAEGEQLRAVGKAPPLPRRREVWLLDEDGGRKEKLPFTSREELLGTIVECCQAHMEGGEQEGPEKELSARIASVVLTSVCKGMSVAQVEALVRPALAAGAMPAGQGPQGKEFWGAEVSLDALADGLAETEIFQYVDEEVGEQEGGSQPSADRDLWDPVFMSTKVRAVLEELREIRMREGEEKTVVFSQFTTFLDVLCTALYHEGIGYERLDGTMARQSRVTAIERFHSDRGTRVFLVSLKSGGMGLNLVCANNVLLADLWWNAAAEDQAMDRVHRVGQKRDVRVVRFVTERTVEERILELQNKKRAMIRGAMHHKLTMDDVKQLFASFSRDQL